MKQQAEDSEMEGKTSDGGGARAGGGGVRSEALGN